ncbi:PAS domain S-box protein [Flavitalea sp. BT771]|uniref:PAS domain S-box protein n=1 Tax=Flavitalea sp. BT771 TaxID=3063329 RepID=UPI0026E2D974|nr:PAS domain S-box protein [Flavitalea sp. BT771]MDO6433371.1 PAS domain S-box protein [Flavitalea sp. BT771]MDV6222724.1 PAS domain S-box protein [Flavitalea sp. BT771]
MFRQIADFFTRLFDDTDWPPKWHCGRWTEFHGWLYIVSDLLIWAAYFSIPLAIIRYISKKQGLPFLKLYFLFAAFILACGSTHFLDAIAFWIPMYRLNALVRLITGVLSWITVFSVVKLLPQAFSLRSPQELEAEITQRKLAEEQSRENEAQVQTIFDAAPDAIIVMDELGRISKWNPRAEAIFGWTAGEVTGSNLNEVIIPHRYRDAHQKGLARCLETGKSTVSGKTIEIQALDKSGAELDVALRISPAVRQGRRHFIGFIRDISEQKKAREEIHKLNETLEQRVAERTAALNKSIKEISDYKYALDESSIVAITNQKGIITHVNENFCRISKYSAEELIGQDHRIINSGYHPAEYIRHLWATIAHGKIWRGELRNKARDGGIYWVDTTIVPFLDENGKPYQYVAIRADITERKQAEQAFRESQQLLRAIVDNSEAVIYVKDLQGQYLMVNSRFLELFHLDASEVLGKTDRSILPSEAADAVMAVDRRVMAAGRTLKEEELIPQDDGIHTYISVKSTMNDASGRPYAIFGISTDITELKGVEENLRKTLKEVSDYKLALDEASIVAITNQKGIITHVNDNFCRISKYSAEELLGQDHRLINSVYHPAEYIRNLWVTIANGKIWRGELRNKAKDGSIYWVDTTIIPFLEENGKPYQYVAIRADITDRKKAEEELHKLNEELENRITLRTAQLETATKEMEAFAYSVSHDLRAPLRGITGFASILEEEYSSKLDAEAHRITTVIINNAQKMGRLIDDLLAFSRTSRQDIIKTTIPTPSMVQAVTEELTAGMDASSIEWELHPLPKVRGDLGAIRQVWVNLLSNALKYSAGRKPARIEVGSYQHEGQIAFFVKDNGVGFDNKYKGKLFRVFQRLHTADQFEGTGIGLALVEKIVSKHGGAVWAEGEPGNGACFTFSLPVD